MALDIWLFLTVLFANFATSLAEERGKAQAFNDCMVFATTTVASLMAGVVLELKGWAVLNYLAFALVCVALLVIGIFRWRHPVRG